MTFPQLSVWKKKWEREKEINVKLRVARRTNSKIAWELEKFWWKKKHFPPERQKKSQRKLCKRKSKESINTVHWNLRKRLYCKRLHQFIIVVPFHCPFRLQSWQICTRRFVCQWWWRRFAVGCFHSRKRWIFEPDTAGCPIASNSSQPQQ